MQLQLKATNIANKHNRLKIPNWLGGKPVGYLRALNRELTLKCKLKCYVKPMKYPLEGIREPQEVKKKFFWPRCGSNPHVVPWFPLLGLTRPVGLSWVSNSTLIYTWELILCFTICAHSATRHNILICARDREAEVHQEITPANSIVFGSKKNLYVPLIYLPSFYRTVCFSIHT